ncbi:hypothetical protein D3C81_1568720 [compost metagenome]
MHSRLMAQAVLAQAPASKAMHWANSGRVISMPPKCLGKKARCMPMLFSKAIFSAGTLRSCSARMALAAMVGRTDFRSSSRGFGFFMSGLFLIGFEDAISM